MSGLDAETRAMVAHTLERFVAEHYEPARRLARLKGASVDYRENWPLLVGLGLFGLPVPTGLVLVALVELERDYLHEWVEGRDDGIGASVLKVRGSELLQRMSELWREAFGPHGACYDAADRHDGDGLASANPAARAAAINYQYLYGRCWTVFGGSSEVQRNIIAANLLRG